MYVVVFKCMHAPSRCINLVRLVFDELYWQPQAFAHNHVSHLRLLDCVVGAIQLEHPSEGFIHIPIASEVMNLDRIVVCWGIWNRQQPVSKQIEDNNEKRKQKNIDTKTWEKPWEPKDFKQNHYVDDYTRDHRQRPRARPSLTD